MAFPIEELTSIHQILHLTHHRNKNQHRLAKWYKSFSQLRRHASKLLTELETLETFIALSAKSKKTEEARDAVEKRVEFLERWLVPRCYLAFSAVVADNQYAALGLMLLGTLARVKTVIRPLGKKEIDDEQEVEVVGKSEDLAEDVGDDLGEVVMRETLDSLSVENDEQVPDEADEDDEFRLQNRRSTEKRKRTSETGESRTEATVERTPTKPSKKKKRKKGDVFDVLFDSLI